jgi:hypothetical protein
MKRLAHVMSGRGRWVRKCFLPQFDVGSRGVEFDASEEVPSCPLHPQLGDDATRFERRPFVTYVVEDEVEDLRREEGRHRGLCQSCFAVFHYHARLHHQSRFLYVSTLKHNQGDPARCNY